MLLCHFQCRTVCAFRLVTLQKIHMSVIFVAHPSPIWICLVIVHVYIQIMHLWQECYRNAAPVSLLVFYWRGTLSVPITSLLWSASVPRSRCPLLPRTFCISSLFSSLCQCPLCLIGFWTELFRNEGKYKKYDIFVDKPVESTLVSLLFARKTLLLYI